MELYHQPNFLSAVREIMKDGISALTLSLEEIFYIANEACSRKCQIHYGDYVRFLESLNPYGEPPTMNPKIDEMLGVYKFIKGQEAKQKRALLAKIQEGGKDWRRFVWLLQQRQREERLKLAIAKQKERERKEQQKAAEEAAKQNDTRANQPLAIIANSSIPHTAPTTPAPELNEQPLKRIV